MYNVIEIDALDRHTIISRHKRRRDAYARVHELRKAFGKDGLRYIVSKA